MKKRTMILVVDSDLDILKILSHALKLEGYGVAVASNGRAALSLLEECKPGLVILDIVMPELDGRHVLDLIRQRSNVPVIVITELYDVMSLQKAKVIGADDYVKKPFNTSGLMTRVKAKLRHTY